MIFDFEKADCLMGVALHSVHAHHLEFVIPRICDRGFARIREHDRRAIGREQRKQIQAWRHLRRLREQSCNLFRTNRAQIGDATAAKLCKRFG